MNKIKQTPDKITTRNTNNGKYNANLRLLIVGYLNIKP